jgi:hypothetical protein
VAPTPPCPPAGDGSEGAATDKACGPDAASEPLYLRDSCPRHRHGGWAQLTSCAHHRTCLEEVRTALGGRIVPAAGTSLRCGVLTDGRCGCGADWLLLTGGAQREIRARYGRVPDAVIDGAMRVAVADGRDVLDLLALAAEVRSERVRGGTSWADAWNAVRQYGSLAGLDRAMSSTPDGPRLALSARARAVARRLARES